MGFANYTDLQDEIRSFLWDRTDVVAKIPSFIALAESEMRRELRTQQVVVTRPISISSDVVALPSNERQIMSLDINLPDGAGTLDLTYATPEQMSSWSDVTPQRPRFYTIQNNRLQIFPTPDQSYTGTLTYRSAFDPLSASNVTNWILERHPDIYLSGSLKWAKAWLIDPDWDWASPFYSAIAAANKDQPMRQSNTTLRADDVTSMSRRGGYDVYSDSYRTR